MHRYPGGRDAASPHPGFETRDAEIQELFRLVEDALIGELA